MIISVASGKGGTGKTTIAVNLALSLGGKDGEFVSSNDDIMDLQILDCDVEEPNAHIFLKPSIKDQKKIYLPVPEIDKTKCDFCGKCAQICAYNAIAVIKDKVLVFPELCHGCGGCTVLCPQGAISETDKEIGVVEDGLVQTKENKEKLQFIQGRLNIGEAMAPPLIRAVKGKIGIFTVRSGFRRQTSTEDSLTGKTPLLSNKAEKNQKVAIIDAPPGTSCPVIEAVKGSDFCVLVTEPTPFGLNDLILAVEVLEKLEIPFGVVINRSDIGDNKVEEYLYHCNILQPCYHRYQG